jgi:hypothetical protein
MPATAILGPAAQTDQVNPSLLALFGLAYLALSPFSVVHGNIRIAIAVAFVAVCIAVRPKLLGPRGAQSLQALDRARLSRIYIWSGFIFLGAIFCDAISTAILIQEHLAEGMEILDRGGKQLGTLLVSLFQLASGYHLAKYIKVRTVQRAIYWGFAVTIIVCGYQVVAEQLGLPYIGILAVDPAEPKGLAVYLLTVVPLLLVSDGVRRSTLIPPFPQLIGIGLALYFFFQTVSANGYLSAAILLAMYFLAFTSARRAILGICLLLAALMVVPGYQLSEVQMRASHQGLLDNLQNLDLGLLDDLIVLPLITWRAYPLGLLIGFGPGLLHFFAWQYVDQGVWLLPGTYIDGAIGAIKYPSDFGLIEASILFAYIFRKARHMFVATGADELRPLKVFFLSTFVLGALVGGNVTGPLFLAVGWILGTSEVPRRAVTSGYGLISRQPAVLGR